MDEISSINSNDGLMTLLTIIGPIIGFIIIVIMFIYIDKYLCRRRALREPPIGFKQERVYDRKAQQLRSVRTPIHLDNQSGKRFFGKTIFE